MVEDDLLMKLDFEMRELGARPNLREFARVSGRQKWKLQRGLGRFVECGASPVLLIDTNCWWRVLLASQIN